MTLKIFIFTIASLHLYNSEVLDFAQNDYDVTMDIAEVAFSDKTIFKSSRAGFDPYNRTQRVYNATHVVIKNLYSDTMLNVQLYKMMSNEYRFFPVTVNVNICAEITRNTFNSREILARVSNFDFCNLKEGTYWIRNAIADFTKCPPHMPRGKYKMASRFLYETKLILEVHMYGTVKDKNV